MARSRSATTLQDKPGTLPQEALAGADASTLHTTFSPEATQALTKYVYAGEDRSYLYRYIGSPLAQFCVDWFTPRWLAPNVITLAALLLQLFTVTVVCITSPTLSEPVPSWVAALGGLSLFLYSVLDNMDGKQARRTGSSSPLGLLFDHGCDAINAGIVGPLILHGTLGVRPGDHPWHFLAIWLVPTIPFYFATYEEYFTGRFVLPVMNGPNEGLAVIITAYALTALWGAQFWTQPVKGWFMQLAAWYAGLTLVAIRWCAGARGADLYAPVTNLDVLFANTAGFAASTVVVNTWTAFRSPPRPHSASATRDGHSRPSRGTLLPPPAALQVPIWLLAVTATAWMASSLTLPLVRAHPYLFITTMGAQFAYQTSVTMLHHVSASEEPRRNYVGTLLLLAPVVIHAIPHFDISFVKLTIATIESLATPDLWLWASFTVSYATFFHLILTVVPAIANALNIQVFAIPSPKDVKTKTT